MSPPHCSAGPTLSPVATANASQTATDAMVLMIAMTTVMKSTVALIVMHFFFFNLVDYIIPHINPTKNLAFGFLLSLC